MSAPVANNRPSNLTSSTYPYKDLANNDIRLLEFTQKDTAEVHCSLRHVPLDPDIQSVTGINATASRTSYIALSYAWGGPDITESIWLDGHRFGVRRNLHDCLQQLRKSALHAEEVDTRYFWIDAICINQQNTKERNVQVTRIKSIFRSAHIVYCALASHWNKEFQGKSQIEILDVAQAAETIRQIDHSTTAGDTKEVIWKGIQDKLPIIAELCRFFLCPYWTRLWIMQEIALATGTGKVKVLIGDQTLAWEAVIHAAEFAQAMRFEIQACSLLATDIRGGQRWPHWYKVTNIETLRNQLQNGEYLSDAFGVVDLVRRSTAQLEHDKVYGVLSLLKPKWAAVLEQKIDYGKSHGTVYTEFTTVAIESEGSLSGLPHCSKWNGLPSWVPDLTYEYVVRKFAMPCTASLNLVDPGARPKPMGQILNVFGMRLDSICNLTAIRLMDDVREFAHSESTETGLVNYTDYSSTPQSEPLPEADLLETLTSSDRTGTLPSAEWLENNKAISNNAKATLDFFQQNATFALPGGKTLSSYLQVSETARSTTQSRDYAAIVGEIDYQTSLRRLATTESSRLALVPPDARTHDVICVIQGLDTLAVLRRKENDEWRWVGNCFIKGWMEGGLVAGVHGICEEFKIS